MPNNITESIVEQATLDWIRGLGYEVLSGLAIAPGEPTAERSDYKQVFLFRRLQTKLEDLNPRIPLEGLQEALRNIRLISHPTLIENNRAFHRLLVEGVDVEFRKKAGEIVHDKVWLIDFANPEANEFLAVNQFTVEEGHFNRRADVVMFINGIPLAVLELKNITDANATIRGAFNQLQTYKAQIPSLFHSNALLVISDGHEARLGTVTSDWERFMTWRTITGKELVPPGSLQLETLLKGVFDRHRLLDLIRNFIVFEDDGESHHRRADRPQRPGRPAFRHVLVLQRVAAANAGAGKRPGEFARVAQCSQRRRGVHHYSEVLSRRKGREASAAVRPAQHRRHRRRSAPQPIRFH